MLPVDVLKKEDLGVANEGDADRQLALLATRQAMRSLRSLLHQVDLA